VTRPNLTGVFPPLITPFTGEGEVDDKKVVANMKRWNAQALAGYLVLGSNSEAVFLGYEEKLRLVELVAEEAADGRVVIAGTGMESAHQTIRLTNDVAVRGAHAALVLTPFYYKEQMTDDALVSFYVRVAEGSKIPILIYNVPKFTQVNLTLSVLQRLSEHPNIIGMKDSKGDADQLRTFKAGLKDSFQILAGTASVWLPALEMGIRGGFLALANCCADECTCVQELFDGGKRKEAQELHTKLYPVNHTVTVAFGVPGLKYACELRGFEPGLTRNPLQPLGEDQKAEIRAVLKEAGLWDGG
jgi:4-hydroxy-2-oxoglutarate aldolase